MPIAVVASKPTGVEDFKSKQTAVMLWCLLSCCALVNCRPSGFPTKRMRPCAISAVPGRRRFGICAVRASISCHSCFGTAGSSKAVPIGASFTVTGWQRSGLITERSRLPWKNTFIPSNRSRNGATG